MRAAMALNVTRGLDLDAAENGVVDEGLSAASIFDQQQDHNSFKKGGSSMDGDSRSNGKLAIERPRLRHPNTLMEYEVKPYEPSYCS